VDVTEVVSGADILLQSFAAPPYRTLLPIAVNDSGPRTFKIVATDNLGGKRTAVTNVTVIPDPLPSISITSPADGTQLVEGQQFTAAADAHDNRGIARVTFAINGVESLSVTVPPYSRVLTVPVGSTTLSLQATAIDDFGQTKSTTKSYTVLFNQPPVVALTSPAQGAQIYGGQTVTLAADAGDDYGIEAVAFNVNGVETGGVVTPPYSQPFTVPAGATSLTVQATALDIYGKSTSVSRVLPVLDPLTTITGRVTDLQGNSISGASVTLDNSGGRATTTDGQGAFSFGGVATVPQGVHWSASVYDAASGQRGHSVSLPPVLAGTTDLGIIALATQVTTPLPITPSATGKGDYTGDAVADLFVGFPDRQSRVYISNGLGQFSESTSLTLPFGAVRSGTSADVNNDGKVDILAQPVGQAGNVTLVLMDGAGGIQSTTSFATGLDGEAEVIATGLDDVNSPAGLSLNSVKPNFGTPPVRRRVLAFLSVTNGTSLTVRFFDPFGGFTPPVTLPVDPAVPLRSLTLYDVTGDHLVDLIAIKRTANGDRVVVFPRISGTQFGAPIDSPIAVRAASTALTTMDYAIGDFDADSQDDLAVIGDDRVRIYRGDGSGVFTLLGELELPEGVVASAIATPYGAVAVGEDLIVVTRDADSPERKSLLLYENNGFGGTVSFAAPIPLNYSVPGTTGDSRLVIDHFAGEGFIEDAVIVDGETLTLFVDVVR